MKVIAAEYGDRPYLLTKARRFAPQGLRILADTFGRFDFADVAALALDWSNVLDQQPDEAAKPVLIIETLKFVGDKTLKVQVRLDVDDLFGRDEIMAEDFVAIARSMEDRTNEEIARAYAD